jgi:hypothetical protein
MNALNAAGDRFFRSYYQQCTAPDPDTLFNLLNALHSLNDKLGKAGKANLFGSSNFLALKALRNLFHHETELVHEIRIVPVGDLPTIETDLLFLCLVERSLIERAIKRDEKDRERIASAFKWYGSVVNIQPCVFNVAVDVFEDMNARGIVLSSAAYGQFKNSHCYEEEYGHFHRVTGDIVSHAGNVEEVLSNVFLERVGGPPKR